MKTSTAVIGVFVIYILMSVAFIVDAKEVHKPKWSLVTCAASQYIAADGNDIYNDYLHVYGETAQAYFNIGRQVGVIDSSAKQYKVTSESIAEDILKKCREDGIGGM